MYMREPWYIVIKSNPYRFHNVISPRKTRPGKNCTKSNKAIRGISVQKSVGRAKKGVNRGTRYKINERQMVNPITKDQGSGQSLYLKP